MNSIINNVRYETERMRERISELEVRVRKTPPHIRKCRLRRQDLVNGFYLFIRDSKGSIHRVHPEDSASVEKVDRTVEYRYELQELRTLQNNLAACERFLKNILPDESSDILNRLPKAYRGTPWPGPIRESGRYRISDSEWVDINNERNPYHPEGRNVPAACGLLTRSKSEADIADGFRRSGIVFRYEPAVEVQDGDVMRTYFPDFEIRTSENGSILLEHLGRLDDPDYVERNMHKLQVYIENGWIPGKNLILTGEKGCDLFSAADVEVLVEMVKMKIARA